MAKRTGNYAGWPESLKFKKGYDSRRFEFSSEKAKELSPNAIHAKLMRQSVLPWNETGKAEQRRRLFKEQNGKCNGCKNDSWRGMPIVLEKEHKNGNHFDNRRENVELLCPNCHSQTSTWRNKKRPANGETVNAIDLKS